MKKLNYLWLAVMLITACSKNSDTSNNATAGINLHNVRYGDTTITSLDISLPANRSSKTALVILLHGGHWITGDKSDMAAFQDSLRAHGIASATVNYSYASSSVNYDSILYQLTNAISFCTDMAEQWKIQADKIIVAGIDAGAHLALLYTYSYNNNQLAGVVAISGISDLTNTDWLDYAASVNWLDAVENLAGSTYTPGQTVDNYFSYISPAKHLRNIPTLLIHGQLDTVMPYGQATALADALDNNGIPHKLVTLAAKAHLEALPTDESAGIIINELLNWVTLYGTP